VLLDYPLALLEQYLLEGSVLSTLHPQENLKVSLQHILPSLEAALLPGTCFVSPGRSGANTMLFLLKL
jgi:hypothetical protein